MKKERKPGVQVGVNAFTAQATSQREKSGLVSGLVMETPPARVEESSRTVYPETYPRELIRPMGEEEIQRVSQGVLAAMTFGEKCELLHSQTTAPKATGCSSFVAGVPRLGVPAMVENDGPSGPNGIYETTNLPVGLLTGCTFSPALARKYGRVLGRDLKSVGGNWQLGAQFDVTRSPYWMRCRDTFGEDYFLTGEMAVEETLGLQESGVGAMAKHMGAYATNGDGGLCLEVDEQTLHTAYLYPFEQAARRGRVSSIMTTYNRINGVYCASSEYLNKTVVRDYWNWKGNITTDAGGNQEFSVHLGTDNEMATCFNCEENVRAYLRAGLISMEDVDTAVLHILWGYGVAGYLGMVQLDPDTGLAKEEPGRTEPILPRDTWYQDRIAGQFEADNAVACEIARKGMVLLKNENQTLPLTDEKLREGVALIGFGAKYPVYGTGFERSQGVQQYIQTPAAALKELVPDAKLTVEPLNDLLGRTIPAGNLFQDEACTRPGLVRTWGIRLEDSFVVDPTAEGAPPPPPPGIEMPPRPFMQAEQTDVPGTVTGSLWGVDETLEFLTRSGGFFNGLEGNALLSGSAYTWKGYLKAEETGDTVINLQNMGGLVSLELFDGERPLIQTGGGNDFGHGAQWEFDLPTEEGMASEKGTVRLEAGHSYRIQITARAEYPEKDLQLRLAWYTPSMKRADYEGALAAAQSHKTVIYFARMGLIGHLGMAPADYDLRLNDLEALLAVQKAAKEAGNTFILLVNSRSAFSQEGGWLENTDALAALFYGGQAQNTALAQLLTGRANFSGRLCVTMPKTSADLCTHCSRELQEERWGQAEFGKEIAVKYSEGLDFGYRWNARTGVQAGWPFGFGLSYTTFAYENIRVEPEGEGLRVTVTVANTGSWIGDEVVQVYLGEARVPDHIQSPKQQLAGFARLENLAPGERRTCTIFVPGRMLSYWDPRSPLMEREDGTRDKWVRALGPRAVMIGRSAEEIWARTEVQIL